MRTGNILFSLFFIGKQRQFVIGVLQIEIFLELGFLNFNSKLKSTQHVNSESGFVLQFIIGGKQFEFSTFVINMSRIFDSGFWQSLYLIIMKHKYLYLLILLSRVIYVSKPFHFNTSLTSINDPQFGDYFHQYMRQINKLFKAIQIVIQRVIVTYYFVNLFWLVTKMQRRQFQLEIGVSIHKPCLDRPSSTLVVKSLGVTQLQYSYLLKFLDKFFPILKKVSVGLVHSGRNRCVTITEYEQVFRPMLELKSKNLLNTCVWTKSRPTRLRRFGAINRQRDDDGSLGFC